MNRIIGVVGGLIVVCAIPVLLFKAVDSADGISKPFGVAVFLVICYIIYVIVRNLKE